MKIELTARHSSLIIDALTSEAMRRESVQPDYALEMLDTCRTIAESKKNQKISDSLLTLMSEGKTLKEAWNIVFPAIPFDRIVGEIYEALRNKEVA